MSVNESNQSNNNNNNSIPEKLEEVKNKVAELEKNNLHLEQLRIGELEFPVFQYEVEKLEKKVAELEKKIEKLEKRNAELEKNNLHLERQQQLRDDDWTAPDEEWCGGNKGRPKNRKIFSQEPLTQDEIYHRIKMIKVEQKANRDGDRNYADKHRELKKELKFYQDLIISSFVLGGESDLRNGFKFRCKKVVKTFTSPSPYPDANGISTLTQIIKDHKIIPSQVADPDDIMTFGECVKLLRSDSKADKPKVIPQLDGGGDDYEGEYDAEQDKVVVMSGKPSSLVSELFPELKKFAPLLDERVHIAFERADGNATDGDCDYRRELENILTQNKPYNRKDPQTILRQKFLITHTQMTGKAGFTWWWIYHMVEKQDNTTAKFLTRIKSEYPALFKCMIIYDSIYLDGKFYKKQIKKMSEAEIVLLQEQV